MLNDAIWIGHLPQGVASMARLSAARALTWNAQRLGFGFFQAIRGWRLAGIAAGLRQTAFQFRHLGHQRLHLPRQSTRLLYLRKQRTNQRIFLANAELGKIGKFVHADANALGMPWT